MSVNQRFQRLLKLQTMLASLAAQLGPAFDLDVLLGTVLDHVRPLLDCEGGAIWLADGDDLRVAALSGAGTTAEGVPPVMARSGLARKVLASGEAFYAADVSSDPRVPADASRAAAEADVVSYLGVPLVCLREVVGVLEVHSPIADTFDDEARMVLEGVAAQVAGAVESARRYESMAQLETMKSDFIARVSHELRTPITIVSGFVATLLSHHGSLSEGDRVGMLDRIDSAVARLSGLVDELLMLSKIEAGVVYFTPEPVELRAVLEQVAKESSSPVDVTIVCAPDVEAETDRALLVRALGLLVDNALKYAGHVELRGGGGAVEVIDHGPGIPAEARSVLFERFARDTVNTTVAGMGVGLPIARTLAAALGAELDLVSTGGAGTHWRIQLG